MSKYDYTVYPDNSIDKFREACKKIERRFTNAIRKKMLEDVDGSTIQEYVLDNKSIIVYDDYDIGAVFVKSDINLNSLFN